MQQAAVDSMVGQLVLGRYRIVSPLARGGMGVVYLGRTEGAAGFSRPVVIKRVLPDLNTESLSAMFIREARILSNLQHPSIVGVVDFGEEAEGLLMVLEYVHGYHLGQWLSFIKATRGSMEVDTALHVVIRVLDALHYAHTLTRPDGTRLHIVHRDISPGNVLLDLQGNVKLVDFGVARMSDEAGEYKTQDGTFKGKFAFTAPEVYQGSPATPRSDVYSCAVVLYQLLAGENPYRGRDINETVKRVLTEEVAPISSKRADVPAALDVVLARALAREPERRFETALELANALREVRSRPDDSMARMLAEDVRRDFLGSMPERLGLQPLAERDAAWRDAQDVPDERRLPLASTPPSDATATGERGHVRPTVPTARPESVTHITSTVAGPNATPSSSNRLLWFAMTGLAVAVVAVLALSLSRPTPAASGAPRYLVVEKQAGATPAAAEPAPEPLPANPAALSSAPANALPEASASASPSVVAPPVKKAGSSSAIALSRTFARREGDVQTCFANQAKDVTGQPRITIRFSTDQAGKVQGAELSPASLSGTTLGQCLLRVARSTQFGTQDGPLSFSIPITARRVP
jgi:serine/threonine-protein kinase